MNRASATRVVAAVQSPTLLNILATSSAWSLKVCAMGDHGGLDETSALRVPSWNNDEPPPDVVLVCAPSHREFAKRWPAARVLWVIHNGSERGLLPKEHEEGLAGVVCFSERVRWICQAGRSVRCHFVSPAYEAAPTWKWAPDALWSLRNRPDSRRDDRDAIIPAVVAGQKHTFYGQGQAAGFLDAEGKSRLRSSCSAYVSCLSRGSGFGLAEHEAFAAGVPVVGGYWGDIEAEMSPDYWSLAHHVGKMHLAAQTLAQRGDDAATLSELGLAYIREYRTVRRMDETIAAMLDQLG